jgi:aspartyl-tRNA(Asn)/glutamyl-tRNA(Gln) amidotransferase subunit A
MEEISTNSRRKITQRIKLPRITLRQFESLISSKAVTVPQLTSYCPSLAIAGELVWKLNAFASVFPAEDIRAKAQASQKRWDAGQPLSPLDGVPITVKANLAVKTQPLTAGSAILGHTHYESQPRIGYTADVVHSLESKGAIIIGITQMDELGMQKHTVFLPGVCSDREFSSHAKTPLLSFLTTL